MRTPILVLIVLAAASVPLSAADTEAAACQPEPIHGLGLACQLGNGLYEVFSPDGHDSLGYTHGLDPVPAGDEPAIAAGGAPRPVACVPPGTPYAVVVIYAHAHDDADRYALKAYKIRELVEAANALVDDAARVNGDHVDLRVVCDGDGEVMVNNEVLATDQSEAGFGSIVTDLRGLGYTDGTQKYWVYYDDTGACTCGGTGHIWSDERAGPENRNNGNMAAMFAVTFGYDSVRIMLHELGHNMGAVQRSAPYTTGAAHCIDGADIMCYDDGGPYASGYNTTRCSQQVWDCGQDTYFNTTPAQGSWLDTHWNTGSGVNRFVTFGQDRPVVQSLQCTTPVTVAANVTCWMRAYADHDVSMSIDWGDGTVSQVPAEGYAPPGQTRYATHRYSDAAEHHVRVTATTDNGGVSLVRTFVVDVRADADPPHVQFDAPLAGTLARGCDDVQRIYLSNRVMVDEACVRISATDIGSGIARLDLYLRDTLVASTSADALEYRYPLTQFERSVRFTAVATDHAGLSETRIIFVETAALSSLDAADPAPGVV